MIHEDAQPSQTNSSSNKVKTVGIVLVLLAVIGVVFMQYGAQEEAVEKLPPVVEHVPEPVQQEPVQVAQIQDNRAAQLQTEIEDLLERLKKVRKQMGDHSQKWQQEIQNITNKLQTATTDALELSNALTNATKQAEHWPAVELLADKVVYTPNAYTQVPEQLSNAEQLIQGEDIQAAVDLLTPIKTALIKMLGQAENTDAVVVAGSGVREARNNWQTLVTQQSWDQLPLAVKVEKEYQGSYQDENEGRFAVVLTGYGALLKSYGSLQHAGETLVATQPPLETAKGGWEALANEYGLNEIPFAIKLDKDYTQYQQTISGGELLAASEKAIVLEKGYSDLLAGAQNITEYRDKALKAKKDWDAYANMEKLTIIPQHKLWASNMDVAELDLKAGKLPKAGTAYKQLAENYTSIHKYAELAIEALSRALLAQQNWNEFASANKLKISRATAAEADLNATVSAMRKGEFEQVNKTLTVVAVTYEGLLANARLALLALQETTIYKKDCASMEKAINKKFCSMANTDYDVTLAMYKRGEFVVAKTQFDELALEYKRLFIVNGQNTTSVAGLDITLQTIPAGSFRMGANKESNKKFVRDFSVPTFKMMVKEVTFAQYDAYAKSIGKRLPKDEGWGRGNRPVVNVNWNDAQSFASWLSRKSGKKFRLPTEAEWEYAAVSSRTTNYNWGDSISCNEAIYNGGKKSDCYYKHDGQQGGTVPVGSFNSSPWGLYDMSGNVWEWTQDCADENYHNVPGNIRFWDGKCEKRVVRGGSWSSSPERLYSVSYDWNNPKFKTHVDGFRLVQEL